MPGVRSAIRDTEHAEEGGTAIAFRPTALIAATALVYGMSVVVPSGRHEE
jgi:hypothetical protein